MDPRIHADLLIFAEGVGISSGPFWDLLATSFLSINGAEHRRLRSIVAMSFTPKSVDAVRPLARAEAHRRIDHVAPRGECEFVESFAAPYVAAVTAAFLGIPYEDLGVYLPYVGLVNSRSSDPGRRAEECTAGALGLTNYARSLVRGEDQLRGTVIATIARSVREGDLPESTAVSLVVGLLSAGNDPTINQLGVMIEVMSEQPHLWDALCAGESEPAPVIEEVLRFRPTNHQVNRRVAKSFEYDGVRFEEGQQLIMRLVAANHDRCRFANPDEFDLEANYGSHVAFGFGPHYCLGAALARAQLQEALRALTVRLTCPTVLESVPKPEGGIVGPARLSISFTARGESSLGLARAD
jgi:cytochrome P450